MHPLPSFPDPSDVPPGRTPRHDGWTPERQRTFLEALSEGHTVEAACRIVGLSPASAYALRRRAAGAAFAIGWQAAALLARDKLADALLARAIDGQRETITRANGDVIERHRYDNRLATAMLTRLDRLADARTDEGTHQAARMVAGEWDAFLDLVDRGEGPLRAGLFLALRATTGEDDPDLAAVRTLARADRWLRQGAAHAAEVPAGDLDPGQRATWTAEQWARAEAAGLVTLAPVPCGPDGNSQLSQLEDEEEEEDEDELEEDSPIWFDTEWNEWRTSFPPPPGADVFEDGQWGEDDYFRALTPEEAALANRRRARKMAGALAEGAADRDAWFAALAAGLDGDVPPAPDSGDGGGAPDAAG